MTFTLFMIAFLAFVGIAYVFSLLRLRTGESLFLSTAAIVLVLYLGSLTGSFSYGLTALYVIGAGGWVLMALCLFLEREALKDFWGSPVIWVLSLSVLLWLVLYFHDFIQRVDEFHFWAAAVKYMMTRDRMPFGNDFLGGGGQYSFATSLFLLFFQKTAGYNEQLMYVSSSLFLWTGALLPFAGAGRKQTGRIALYFVTLNFAMFSLYMHGPKNLYVDMPLAAWAGGMCGWWINRDKKRTDWLILGSGLVMLHFIKGSAGLLMAVFTGAFALLSVFYLEREKKPDKSGNRKLYLLGGLVCACLTAGGLILAVGIAKLEPVPGTGEMTVLPQTGGIALETEAAPAPAAEETAGPEPCEITWTEEWSLGGHPLPAGISNTVNIVKLSADKVGKTAISFVTKLVGAKLSSKPATALAFAPFLLSLLCLFWMLGDLRGKKALYHAYIAFLLVTAYTFLFVLFFSFLCMFAYELSVNTTSITRYFAIFAVFALALFLTVLYDWEKEGEEQISRYLAVGILILFSLNINKNYVINATAIDKEEVSSYREVSKVVRDTSLLPTITGPEARVYLINQKAEDQLASAEIVNAASLYYLTDQASNYLEVPWCFHKGGSTVRLEESTLTLEDLPSLLKEGGYQYVWIHDSDKYLRKNLPRVFEMDKVKKDTLYQIGYENGEAAALTPVFTFPEEQEE